jgi:hypothetical protein
MDGYSIELDELSRFLMKLMFALVSKLFLFATYGEALKSSKLSSVMR